MFFNKSKLSKLTIEGDVSFQDLVFILISCGRTFLCFMKVKSRTNLKHFWHICWPSNLANISQLDVKFVSWYESRMFPVLQYLPSAKSWLKFRIWYLISISAYMSTKIVPEVINCYSSVNHRRLKSHGSKIWLIFHQFCVHTITNVSWIYIEPKVQ